MADVPDIRASDRDREHVADALRRHCTEGRITLDELDERLGEAYACRTLGQLAAPTGPLRQLPVLGPLPPAQVTRPVALPAPVRRHAGFAAHLTVYALVNVFLILVWLITGAGYFWPVWPILGWGLGLALHALAVYRPERPR